MLKSWIIQNFKPILDSGELKLAPITVLAGRNSSGKSSLLQSILMIAQTVGNQLPERVLLPNERIIQLGTYEDVLSEFSDSHQMTIGFELEVGQEQLESPTIQTLANTRLDVKSARFIAKFNSGSSNGSSFSATEASDVILENTFLELNCFFKPLAEGIRFLSSQEYAIKLTLIVQRITDTELDNYLNNVRAQDLVPYADRQSNYLAEFISDQLSDRGPFLVALSHFLPVRFVGKITFGERFKGFWMRLIGALLRGVNIDTLLSGPENISEVVNIDVSLSENLRNYIERLYNESEIFPHFSGQTLRDLLIWLSDLRTPSADDREKITGEEFQNLIVQELMSNVLMQQVLDTNILAVVNNSDTDIFSRVISEATNFFTSKIRYLGPLRADPSSTQRLFAPTSQLDDVGFKGEYAAVVYQHYQLATISWYSPYTRQIEQNTLQEALDSWVKYLDVANQVRTESAGNIGVAWKVVVKKNLQARTLPEVGVGVSQILPILVMGLLAPSNTLLILEQPELHLHPSVQARLGDFFMGLSKCGKQCLIETHSENLVSQLRYHIVQAGGQEKSDCLIYFVDQDDQGAARFNPIEISPQGNILNWPDGFFDETMLQEDRITAASLKKRAKKANNA